MLVNLMKFMEAASSLRKDVLVSIDPDDPDLIVISLRFPRNELNWMREELSKSYASLKDRYEGISESGVDEEGIDAWAYAEGNLSSLDDFIERVERYGDIIGTIEVKKGKFGALIYPKGALSGFAVNLAYLLASGLPKEAVTFSLIGYELSRNSIEISFYVSTREECAPEEVHEHEHAE